MKRLLPCLLAAAALITCDSQALGNYTVTNQWDQSVIVHESALTCDQVGEPSQGVSRRQIVLAGSTRRFATLGRTRCIIVTDSARRMLALRRYEEELVVVVEASGRVDSSRPVDAQVPLIPLAPGAEPDQSGPLRVALALAFLTVCLAGVIGLRFLLVRRPAAAAAPAGSGSSLEELPLQPYSPPAPAGEEKTRQPSAFRVLLLYIAAFFIAAVGGLMGILGAFVQEVQASSALRPELALLFLGAPVIEEALKPTGVYIVLIKWRDVLRSRLALACMSALAGLVFGLIESYIYVNVYAPDNGPDYVLFRYTVPVLMHVIASFCVGLGLHRDTIEWANGRIPLPRSTRNFYLLGAGIHALYNIVAVTLSIIGVLEF
jgi:RsiW-degrading membrane proteinase PrsW (M82 family)